MKIPQQNSNSTFQCTNSLTPNQKQNFDAETNQIREKLRKKKQILKQSQRSGPNGHLSSNDKRRELIGCKKSKKSEKQKDSSKPITKMDRMEKDEFEGTTDNQQLIESFYSKELPQYFATKSMCVKQGTKISRKPSELHVQRSVENYLNEFQSQNQIKVLSLLQQKQKLLFKNSKPTSLPQYEQSGLEFIRSIRKKQQKQNCQYYSEGRKLQKRLSLILQKQNNFANNGLFFLRGENQNIDESVQEISFAEKCYLNEATVFEKVWENKLEKKINEPAESKQLAKMLLVLTKCYKSNHKRVNEILQKYQAQEEKSFTSPSDPQTSQSQLSSQSTHQQFYIKTLIKKCLIKTFSQSQTIFPSDSHLWNYFKLTSYLEQNIINQGYRDHQKYVPIESEEEYKEYMKRIKNKKIIYKPSLHTSCKACFSNHFERYNPIVKCPECKSRMHKFCGKIDDRCDKCSYKKLGASLKADTPKCFICLNDSTSLMLYKLKGSRYVHNFCMFVHNLWTVNGERLAFVGENEKNKKKDANGQTDTHTDSTKSLEVRSSSESMNSLSGIIRKSAKSTSIIIHEQKQQQSSEEEHKQMVDESQKMSLSKCESSSENKCKFCLKSSKPQFLKQCKNCQSSCHILCAYLYGCPISITEWKNNFSIELNISCCPSVEEDLGAFDTMRQKREVSRKYKLNYERFALNYGFENQTKTSKNIQSQANLIDVQEQEEQPNIEKETLKSREENNCNTLLEEHNFDVLEEMREEQRQGQLSHPNQYNQQINQYINFILN